MCYTTSRGNAPIFPLNTYWRCIMQEIWKDIKNYEGLYQVSNFGKVKSLPRKGTQTNTEKILKVSYTYNGYERVSLHKNNKDKRYLVHRLVAETFIPNPNNYPQVNHKDENKINNNVSNLEWCTPSYNINYGKRNNNLNKEVWQYDLQGKFIKKWKSTMEIQRTLGFKNQNISFACLEEKHTSHGYIWKYRGVD